MVDDASPTWPAWEAIAELTGIGPGTMVLDVGCGTGGFCELAAARGAVVHGVDQSAGRIAAARRRLPGRDFRIGIMEALPWAAGTFDVVAGFNAFQYALDVPTALAEARRVARAGGQLAVCKYGRPGDNEFFAFLLALNPQGPRLEELPEKDAVDLALERLERPALASGELPSFMTLPSDQALAGALASAGAMDDRDVDGAWCRRIRAAAAPYRQPDGSYRFENRLKYRIVAT